MSNVDEIKTLLAWYVQHVGECEGTDFLQSGDKGKCDQIIAICKEFSKPGDYYYAKRSQ